MAGCVYDETAQIPIARRVLNCDISHAVTSAGLLYSGHNCGYTCAALAACTHSRWRLPVHNKLRREEMTLGLCSTFCYQLQSVLLLSHIIARLQDQPAFEHSSTMTSLASIICSKSTSYAVWVPENLENSRPPRLLSNSVVLSCPNKKAHSLSAAYVGLRADRYVPEADCD